MVSRNLYHEVSARFARRVKFAYVCKVLANLSIFMWCYPGNMNYVNYINGVFSRIPVVQLVRYLVWV